MGTGARGGVQSAGLAAEKARLELSDGLTPSPPSVGEEAVHIKGGLLFENEVGGSAKLGGQDAQGLPPGMLPSEALEVLLAGRVVFEEADGGLAEGPLEVDVSDLGAGGAGFLSIGFFAAFDEAGIGGEVLDGGKAGDVTDLVEEGEAQDLTHAADGSETAEAVRIVDVGLPEDGAFELRDEAVIAVDEGEIGLEAGLDSGIVKELGEILAVGRTGEPASGPRQIVLGEGVLDMGEQFGSFAGEVQATAQKVAGGAHPVGIDVGEGERAGA